MLNIKGYTTDKRVCVDISWPDILPDTLLTTMTTANSDIHCHGNEEITLITIIIIIIIGAKRLSDRKLENAAKGRASS
jgi:hypothetical protein